MEQKAEFTKFIKVEILVTKKHEDGTTSDHRLKAAINPMMVSYYFSDSLAVEGLGDVTRVGVGSREFMIDVPFKEFDKFFDEVERGLDFKIDEQ